MCVLFCEGRDALHEAGASRPDRRSRASRGLLDHFKTSARCVPGTSNGESGRALQFFYRDFPWKAPALDPRPESASPRRIRMKPAGGRSPAGAEFPSAVAFGFRKLWRDGLATTGLCGCSTSTGLKARRRPGDFTFDPRRTCERAWPSTTTESRFTRRSFDLGPCAGIAHSLPVKKPRRLRLI